MKYRIDYAQVISQVESINGDIDEISAQIEKLTQLEQDCRSAWKGEAAEVFLSKLVTLRSELSRTKTQMEDLSSTIKYCADRIQREDREAEERASALNSGH